MSLLDLTPHRRWFDLIHWPRPAGFFGAAVQSAIGNQVHVMIAGDLATEPKAHLCAKPFCGQNRTLGNSHFIRFSGDEFHAAGGAFGVAAAGMQLVDFCFIFQCQDQAFAGRDFKCSDVFND